MKRWLVMGLLAAVVTATSNGTWAADPGGSTSERLAGRWSRRGAVQRMRDLEFQTKTGGDSDRVVGKVIIDSNSAQPFVIDERDGNHYLKIEGSKRKPLRVELVKATMPNFDLLLVAAPNQSFQVFRRATAGSTAGPIDLKTVTLDRFKKLAGTKFFADGFTDIGMRYRITLTLVDMDPHNHPTDGKTRPSTIRDSAFSLVFTAKKGDHPAERIHEVTHPQLGRLTMVLHRIHPLKENPNLVYYEAVLN